MISFDSSQTGEAGATPCHGFALQVDLRSDTPSYVLQAKLLRGATGKKNMGYFWRWV